MMTSCTATAAAAVSCLDVSQSVRLQWRDDDWNSLRTCRYDWSALTACAGLAGRAGWATEWRACHVSSVAASSQLPATWLYVPPTWIIGELWLAEDKGRIAILLWGVDHSHLLYIRVASFAFSTNKKQEASLSQSDRATATTIATTAYNNNYY